MTLFDASTKSRTEHRITPLTLMVFAGPFLFDLDTDATESHDLCASKPTQCSAMKALLVQFETSVNNSAALESTCSVQ